MNLKIAKMVKTQHIPKYRDRKGRGGKPEKNLLLK